MTILVTGAAGFIGFHLTKRLLKEGIEVIGLDNINDYYETSLKEARIKTLHSISDELRVPFSLRIGGIEDREFLRNIFATQKIEIVVNLAAQAGVRHSLKKPHDYINSNIVGFTNILECCRESPVSHLLYASSSSVYGGNTNMPFKESNGVDHPVSLYAATKRANELMAHTYSHLFGIPATGLRFFTVYGPWGRPDMALFLFTRSILEKKPIKIFNNGKMSRDFTFIDDVCESLFRLIDKPPAASDSFDKKNPDPSKSWSPHQIFNIGNSNPTPLMEYIYALEDSLGIKAEKIFLPMQPGDVADTSADTSYLEEWVHFKPSTSVQDGVRKFVDWYKSFYEI